MNKLILKRSASVLILALFILSLFGCGKSFDQSFSKDMDSLTSENEGDPLSNALLSRDSKDNDITPEFIPASGETEAETGKKTTVMIYMVGSNLESRYGAATDDLLEMMSAEVDYSQVNILVCTGGSKRWNLNVPAHSNAILDLSKGEDEWIVAETDDLYNMGMPGTFSSFVNYCTDNYAAEEYALILWDHGGGPLWGYASDEMHNNDGLLLSEIQTALKKTEFRDEKKFKWVGYDACLMGCLEAAKLWSEYADYLIASEELEAGDGWNYDFLSVLDEASSMEAAIQIVDSYASFYEEIKTDTYQPDYTLAVMDLSKYEQVNEALKTLSDEIRKKMDNDAYLEIKKVRDHSKALGQSSVSDDTQGYDLVDLYDFCANMSSYYPVECQLLMDTESEFVVYHASNVENTHGASIYFPSLNSSLYDNSADLSFDQYASSDNYWAFIGRYASYWLSPNDTDWIMDNWSREGDEYLLQLTPEQVQNMTKASYTVMQKGKSGSGEESWYYALCDIKIEPDEENRLHVPSDPRLFCWKNDADKEYASIFKRVDDNGEEVFKSINLYLNEDPVGIDDLNWAQTTVLSDLFIRKNGEDIGLKSVTAADSSALAGKNTIDPEDFYSMITLYGGRKVTYDNTGCPEPVSKWEPDGFIELISYDINQELEFELRNASEFDNEFLLQVNLLDVNDKYHGSECMRLDYRKEVEKESYATPKGELVFSIHDDWAELIRYSGDDEELQIPETVSGKAVREINLDWDDSENNGTDQVEESKLKKISIPDTVTKIGGESFAYLAALEEIDLGNSLKEIGERAFYGCENISEVIFPETLETIGDEAFLSCSSLTTVSLPKSLKHFKGAPFRYAGIKELSFYDSFEDLSKTAFAGMEELEAITLKGEARSLTVEDGVLFTADKKGLLLFGTKKREEYSIPEGVEYIGTGAFEGSEIKELSFPASLQIIEPWSFAECENLLNISIPDSVKQIGTKAFYNFLFLGENLREVEIGSGLREIGANAFHGWNLEYSWNADPGNKTYRSVEGNLTSKAGDVLILPKIVKENTDNSNQKNGEDLLNDSWYAVHVPKGITSFHETVFDFVPSDTHFYIPDSVSRINEYEGKGQTGELEGAEILESTRQYDFTFHCKKGSYAESFAKEHGIEIIYE